MKTQTRLVKITSLRPWREGDSSEVGTDTSGQLLVSKAVLLERLKYFSDKNSMAVIEFDPERKILLEVYPPRMDRIQALGDKRAPEGHVVVHPMLSPTLFQLSKSHPRFDELYALLARAHEERKPVALAVFPGDREIEDVRLLSEAE